MIHFLFLIILSFSCSLVGQQHDPLYLVEEIFQDLKHKSAEYLNQAWELYKKNHPDTRNLGNCLEFTLQLTQELQNADNAYTEFEKICPNRITLEYAQKRYDLEQRKNIINLALLIDVQLRALLLKKSCEPKNNQLINR